MDRKAKEKFGQFGGAVSPGLMVNGGPFSSDVSEHTEHKYYICKREVVDEGGSFTARRFDNLDICVEGKKRNRRFSGDF